MTTVLREELIAAMRQARIDYEHRKAIYVSPYSGHDALVNFHEARGYQSGLAKAVEVLDALTEETSD